MAKCENWPETEPIFIYVQFVSTFYTIPYDCRMRQPIVHLISRLMCVHTRREILPVIQFRKGHAKIMVSDKKK